MLSAIDAAVSNAYADAALKILRRRVFRAPLALISRCRRAFYLRHCGAMKRGQQAFCARRASLPRLDMRRATLFTPPLYRCRGDSARLLMSPRARRRFTICRFMRHMPSSHATIFCRYYFYYASKMSTPF